MTTNRIRALAQEAGATVEEDEGYRDMRVLQIVAPKGKRWIDGAVVHLRVEWARGRTAPAQKHNRAEWLIVKEAIACGLEEIPADEAAFYAED